MPFLVDKLNQALTKAPNGSSTTPSKTVVQNPKKISYVSKAAGFAAVTGGGDQFSRISNNTSMAGRNSLSSTPSSK